MHINGRVWEKSLEGHAKIVSDYRWEGTGIGYGNLGFTLTFYYLYKDNIFIDGITKR